MRFFIVILFVLIAVRANAQIDLNKNYINLSEYDTLDLHNLDYGCIGFEYISNRYFKDDSILYNFYSQIESAGSFCSNEKKSLNALKSILNAARYNEHNACLLPFLRIFDKKANYVYQNVCFSYPSKLPCTIYCSEPKIKFLILFYVHFVHCVKYKLRDGHHFKKIYLVKKNGDIELDSLDFEKLYVIYDNFLTKKLNSNNHRKQDPLQNSDYKWVVEIDSQFDPKKFPGATSPGAPSIWQKGK